MSYWLKQQAKNKASMDKVYFGIGVAVIIFWLATVYAVIHFIAKFW